MTDKQNEIIDIITKRNDPQYNLIKAAEECSELATVLLQFALKPGKVDKQEVIDEIGDVKIRCAILKRIFGKEEIEKRINHKLSKYAEYKDSEKYKNI